MEKVVLAYSGGLDTSIIIPWLKENYGFRGYRLLCQPGSGRRIRTGAGKSIEIRCIQNLY